MSGVSQISAGKYHALAIKDNIVYGWGRNAEDYPLGENANWSQTTPIEITGLTGDILNIEAGDRCSFFITTDGVYAMGLNNCGQLGDGTTETKNIPTLLDISATSIQSNGSTLFYQNGDVYACGANTHGQLGQGYKNTRIETPVKIRGCDYKQMAAGGSHNLLFKCNEQYPYDQYYFRNATIYAMGCNEYGQCMGYIKEDFLKPDVVCEIENTEDVGEFSWNYKDEYIRPIDSTTVSQIDSSMNFYGQPLQVNYTNNERSGDGYGKYSYLKFDISNVPKERISSAKLHLHLYGGDTRASTREIGIYDTYSNEWDGKTMTWESGRVGLKSLLNSFKVTANGYFFNEADEGWHEIDITDYLKYNCIDNELSLALKMISAQAHEVSFVSGIYNDNFTFQDMHINKDMPVLEIKYEQEDAISIQRKSYATSGDTYIYQQKPFNNFSEEQYISINYTPDESRNDYWGQDAYLSFNIDDITVDKRNNIGRAVLWLYVDDTSDTRNSERTINISANDGLKYNASTLVWKAGRISGDSNIGDFTVKGDGYKIKNPGWRQIDVTEFIKSARNSDIEFILKMTSVQAHPTNIRSSEHTQINTRPKLVIDNNLSMEAIDISNNHSTETSSEGTKLYKYVPKETNKYTFSSVGGTELSAILLDENMNQLTVSDNIDGEFKMTYNLEQDKIYYIRVSSGLAANTKYKLYVELPLIITIQ